MRHANREVTALSDLLNIMERCDSLVLAVNGDPVPYIIPLSFGAHVNTTSCGFSENDKIDTATARFVPGSVTLYLHSAKAGAKLDHIFDGAKAAFEMDCDHELAPKRDKGYCTTNYRSIVGSGTIRFVSDPDEQRFALRCLLDHYQGPDFPLNDKALPRTLVYKLVVEQMTGKQKGHARTLELDLSEDATRGNILELLRAELSDKQRAEHAAALDAAGIPDDHCHDVGAVRDVIAGARLSERVKDDMRAVYQTLAEAEAAVHGCAVDETHFHEVGNGEAIRNVAAIFIALEQLDVAHVGLGPVQVGSGTVVCSHGELDIPAPATVAIIAKGIPVAEEKLDGELCTPTSAAVIWRFMEHYGR